MNMQDIHLFVFDSLSDWEAAYAIAGINNPQFHREAAKATLATGGAVAAICGATTGLARGGLLDDRKHTGNAREYLEATHYKGGALYQDEPAVTDGPLITASATAPIDFAFQIFRYLDLYSPAVLAAWYGLFKTGKPEYFAAFMQAAKA
jgi:putative intracellular protease/amidase